MVEKITAERVYGGPTTAGTVRYDFNGDGISEEITFSEFDVAKAYEDCFVKNDQRACKKYSGDGKYGGHYEAVNVQYFTKTGLRGKACGTARSDHHPLLTFRRSIETPSDYDFVEFAPIFSLKTALKGLSAKLLKLSTAEMMGMATDLIAYAMNPEGLANAKDRLVKHLTVLNNSGDGTRMNEKQLKLVADLIWNHKDDLKTALNLSINPFAPNVKEDVFKKVSGFFQSCIEPNKACDENPGECDSDLEPYSSCIDQTVDLSESELISISNIFSEFSDCRRASGRELSGETQIQGTSCAKGSYVEFHENGRLAFATLSKDQVLGGLKFKAGTQIQFQENGAVWSGTISGEQTYGKIALHDGMKIAMDEIGTQIVGATLPDSMMYEGFPAKASCTSLGYADNYDNSGKMKRAHPFILETQLPYNLNGAHVQFYTDGTLRALTLAKDHTIDGIKIPANSQIEFDEEGALLYVWLGGNAVIKGTKFSIGKVINIQTSEILD